MANVDTKSAKAGSFKNLIKNQCFIPIAALLLLAVFNLIADPAFFKITVVTNSAGNAVLSGFLIDILNNGSELAILAIGMTLVTAASGGQDISVGAAIGDRGQRDPAGAVRRKCPSRDAAGSYYCGVSGSVCGSDALWRVQRRAGGVLQDSANDRDTDPLYGRTFNRGMDQQQ